MIRRVVPLLVLMALLVPFAAGASSTGEPQYGITGFMTTGKNHTDYVNYAFTGEGVKTVKLFLVGINQINRTVPSKYLQFSKNGSSRYYALKHKIVIKQAGGPVTIPAGTRYWVWNNPPYNYNPKASINIAVKVSASIPLRVKQCVRTSSIGTTPARNGQPAYLKFVPAVQGYCATGKQWLNLNAN